MISSQTIKFAIPEHWSNHSLRHALYPYINICPVEVQDIIDNGTGAISEYWEKVVAWVLRLKRFIPAGFIPERRKIPKKKQQQLNLPLAALNKDLISKATLRQYAVINNTSKLRKIIDTLGGAAIVGKETKVSERTVNHWPKQMRRGTIGYFPTKYVGILSRFAVDNNIDVSREEIESLLPPKYEDHL